MILQNKTIRIFKKTGSLGPFRRGLFARFSVPGGFHQWIVQRYIRPGKRAHGFPALFFRRPFLPAITTELKNFISCPIQLSLMASVLQNSNVFKETRRRERVAHTSLWRYHTNNVLMNILWRPALPMAGFSTQARANLSPAPVRHVPLSSQRLVLRDWGLARSTFAQAQTLTPVMPIAQPGFSPSPQSWPERRRQSDGHFTSPLRLVSNLIELRKEFHHTNGHALFQPEPRLLAIPSTRTFTKLETIIKPAQQPKPAQQQEEKVAQAVGNLGRRDMKRSVEFSYLTAPPAPQIKSATSLPTMRTTESSTLPANARMPNVVDIGRLTDQVYDALERKIRLEKQRRGYR